MFVQIGAIAHYILLMLLSKRKKKKSYTVDLMHIGYYLGSCFTQGPLNLNMMISSAIFSD